MGNIKYPLNGRHLTLGDLVSEFGYINEKLIQDVSLTDCITKELPKIKNWANQYKEEKILNTSTLTLDKIINDKTTFVTDVCIDNWYKNFSNHIYGGIGTDTFAHSPYELCYFPTVISDTERNETNTKYKTIQNGDDTLFSPDRYIKYKDVIISNGNDTSLMYRIMPLFHYVYIDNNDNTNDNAKTFRFSFNYKISNGLATSIYTLKQLYDISIGDVTLAGSYFSKIEQNGQITNTYFSTLQKDNTKKIVDILLFGSDIINEYKLPSAAEEQKQLKDVSLSNNIFSFEYSGQKKSYCLLYDIAQYKDQIRNASKNYDIQPDAYKILQNYEVRGGAAHNNRYKVKNDTYNEIIVSDPSIQSNTVYSWNDILKIVITGETKDYIEHDEEKISYDIKSYDDMIRKTYYEFDKQNNQNIELNVAYKQINLYYKFLYYSMLLVNCQLYYTGIIVHAVYDVINPLHKYTTEDPLYRCDVGANTDIISVTYLSTKSIVTEYGLTARSIPDTAVINVIIPLNIKTQISENNHVDVRYTWTISDIKKLLRNGVNVYSEFKHTDDDDNITYDDVTVEKLSGINTRYDYMLLSQDSKTLYMLQDNASSQEIIDNINKTLFTLNASSGTFGNNPNPYVPVERSDEINNVDTSLNEYSANNPAVNTAILTNQYDVAKNEQIDMSQFYGTLYSRLTYNNYTFIVNIPIMRLQNYYYEQSKGNNKFIYLFFEDVSQEDPKQNEFTLAKLQQYPIVRFQVETNNQKDITLSLQKSPLYMAYHMQNNVYTKYISGHEDVTSAGIGGSYYNKPISVNDSEVSVMDNIRCYCLSKDESGSDEYNIIINKDNTADITTVTISYEEITTGYSNINIKNKTAVSLSCVYIAFKPIDGIDITADVNYSNSIKSGENGYIYYNTTTKVSNTTKKIYVYFNGKMVPTDDLSYYIISISNVINIANATSVTISPGQTSEIIIYDTPIYVYKIPDETLATFNYNDTISVITGDYIKYISNSKTLYSKIPNNTILSNIKEYITVTDPDITGEAYNVTINNSFGSYTYEYIVNIVKSIVDPDPPGRGEDPSTGPSEPPGGETTE